MRFLLLTVGRDRKGPTAELVTTYVKRCAWPIETIEIAARSQGPRERRLGDEAEKVRQALPSGAAIVVLDERGKDLDSRAFAGQIDRFRNEGRTTLAFIIGGADGLDRSLVAEADLCLAFGRATWPHRLIRAMLAEQIYRASTILAGHPYHRD